MKRILTLAICSIASSCSTPERKLYIHPPVGVAISAVGSPVTVELDDAQRGQVRRLRLPLHSSPDVLKVTGPSRAQLATAADEDFIPKSKTQIRPDPKSETSVSPESAKPLSNQFPGRVSYLRGIEFVNELYNKGRYTDALIQLAPLIDQYPSQSRLFVMRGTIYRKIQEPRAALKAYQAAALLDATNLDLQTLISQLQLELGEGVDND